jgi:hypothetical protein
MAAPDREIKGFIRVVRKWHQLPLWPPSSPSSPRAPPAGDDVARAVIAFANAQAANRAAESDAAAAVALRQLSPNQRCMLMLLKHEDAFLRLRNWHAFFDTVQGQAEWVAEKALIEDAFDLFQLALTRLPSLPRGTLTPACRLVAGAIETQPSPHPSIRFSIALADLMDLDEGDAALAHAQREYPDDHFRLEFHDNMGGCAVDVRPAIGTCVRPMRTHPRVNLPLHYVAHSGTFTMGGSLDNHPK